MRRKLQRVIQDEIQMQLDEYGSSYAGIDDESIKQSLSRHLSVTPGEIEVMDVFPKGRNSLRIDVSVSGARSLLYVGGLQNSGFNIVGVAPRSQGKLRLVLTATVGALQ